MESALTIWNRRRDEAWITDVAAVDFSARVAKRRSMLASGSRVLVCEANPVDFLAGFFAAVTHDQPVEAFLGSSRWSEAETNRALSIARPQIVWGVAPPAASFAHGRLAAKARTLVMIPTGGTTGGFRFTAHSWESLSASVGGVQRWLGGGAINSVCFLPLHHVSGLMQVMRSYVTGGNLCLAHWAEIECGNFPVIPGPAVTSLVPTQLERMRDVAGAADWLRGFACVFLGGARASAAMLDWARAEQLPLAPGYGMTETAAQVATMRPAEFLSGRTISAAPMPHAEIAIVDDRGARQPSGREGRITIRSAALFCGYYPEVDESPEVFSTSDRGVADPDGRIVVLGRLDTIINTGGEKVDPSEVEEALLRTGLVQTVFVLGIPHSQWGELVAAAVVCEADVNEARMSAELRIALGAHKIPKRWLFLDKLPQNSAGKVDRDALRAKFLAQE